MLNFITDYKKHVKGPEHRRVGFLAPVFNFMHTGLHVCERLSLCIYLFFHSTPVLQMFLTNMPLIYFVYLPLVIFDIRNWLFSNINKLVPCFCRLV